MMCCWRSRSTARFAPSTAAFPISWRRLSSRLSAGPSEFVQDGSGEGPELVKRAMPRFLERRQWSGVVHVRLKSQTAVFYFDCVAHAMMRGDQIHGVTVLARA